MPVCHVNRQMYAPEQGFYAVQLPQGFADFLNGRFPAFVPEAFISTDAFLLLQKEYVELLGKTEEKELIDLGEGLRQKLSAYPILSENIEETIDVATTMGQRVADKIADFGGSWTFIICFFGFILAWMALNVFLLFKPYDPFPFILLNLILSCLAAIQAPIIMMSQNRQEDKDRKRSEHDFRVNLKAELEIRLLHEKLDFLIYRQNARIAEIQQLQSAMLEKTVSERKG